MTLTAGNSCGSDIESKTNYITVTPFPDISLLVSPPDGAQNQSQPVYLDWSDVSGASYYEVQVDNNSNFGSPEVDAQLTPSNYSVSGLADGTIYYWRVRAHNSCGWGSWSPIWQFATPSPPDIAVTPTSYDYGNVNLDLYSDYAFTISNTGTGALSVSEQSLTGANPSDFSIVSGGGAFSINPWQTHQTVVRFSPQAVGGRSATLSIASNDPDENPFNVPLLGTGIPQLHLWRVSTIGSDLTGDGSPANPFATIQHGIDVAAAGDTVMVATGTYMGNGNRDIDFHDKGILLISQLGPDSTIIDCGGNQGDPHRGFYFHSGEDSTAIEDGFTVRNGYASGGGGAMCQSSSPAFTHCIFRGNNAFSEGGGAIYCSDGSTPSFSQCLFTENLATDGGAVFALDSLSLRSCTFYNNVGIPFSGTIFLGYGSNASLALCIVWSDSAVANHIIGTPSMVSCCVIKGQLFPGYGNMASNPRFCNPDSGDYYILDSSPCAPENNACGQLIGAYGIGCTHVNRIWHVSLSGNDLTGDGSPSNPFATVQHGIDMASHGDTVLVADGYYYERLNYRGKGVTVASQYIIDDSIIHINNTYIDAGYTGADTGSVVCFVSGEDSTSVLAGLTLTGGTGTLGAGGAIYCNTGFVDSVGPIVSQCRITDNSAVSGGAAANLGNSRLTLRNCQVFSNAADSGGAFFSGRAQFDSNGGRLTLQDCNVFANTASYGGVGALVPGSLRVTGCTIIGDSVSGGFSAKRQNIEIEITGSRLEYCGINKGQYSGILGVNVTDSRLLNSPIAGWAIHIYLSHDTLSNSVVWAGSDIYNTVPGTIDVVGCWLDSTDLGGRATITIDSSYVDGRISATHWLCGPLNIANSLVTGDLAGRNNLSIIRSTILDSVGVYNGSHDKAIVIERSIVYNPDGPAVVCNYDSTDADTLRIICSDIVASDALPLFVGLPSVIDANGVVIADPHFCNPDSGNYYLADLSPCLPSNNQCGELMGALGQGCNYVNRVWHISMAGSDTDGDGSPGNPLRTIQHGIDMALAGDTVLVFAGNYTGSGNRDIDFGGKGIQLRSQLGPDSTLIDCGGNQGDPHRGFYFHSGEDSTTVVDGFTIQNGYGPSDGPNGWSVGGAVFCDTSAGALIRDCSLQGNTAGYGGAVAYIMGDSLILRSCLVSDNSAASYGGALYCYANLNSPAKQLILENCIMDDNLAPSGNVLGIRRANIQIDGCTIDGDGLGVYFANRGRIEIANSTLENCAMYRPATSSPPAEIIITGSIVTNSPIDCWEGDLDMRGDSVFSSDIRISGDFGGHIDIINCHLDSSNVGNRAWIFIDSSFIGGRVYNVSSYSGPIDIHNSLVTRDVQQSGGGLGISIIGSTVLDSIWVPPSRVNTDIHIERSIIYNPDGPAVVCNYDSTDADTLRIVCSDIVGADSLSRLGGYPSVLDTGGVLFADPVFCGEENVNPYTLEAGSPCAAENSPCGQLIGVYDVGCPFQLPGCPYLPGDINGNGSANGIDVVYGVSYFKGGTMPLDSCDCPPQNYPFYAAGDVNGNCTFNGVDIIFYVSYLKGQQPALLFCQDCPPASRRPEVARQVDGKEAPDKSISAPIKEKKPIAPIHRPVLKPRGKSKASD